MSFRIKRSWKNYGLTLLTLTLVFSIWIILYFIPLSFIPDYLDLGNYSKTYELLTLIISSLTSLIGIYVTVTLVAYEFFKQKSGIDFHKSFLVNQTNSIFIAFCVCTVITSFISSLLIPFETLLDRDVSIIYYNAFLFLAAIFFLFPVAFNHFSSLKPGKLADQEIEKINNNTIFINLAKKNNIDIEAEAFENDHLVKVQNIAIALISVSDRIKAQLIIIKCSKKLGQLIIENKDTQERKYITERLISFYLNIIDFTLLQPNNSAILNCVWHSIEEIYKQLIPEKRYAYYLKDFRNDFFQRYFNRLREYNKEELIFHGIETLKNIMSAQLKENTANESEIVFLNSIRSDFEPDFQVPEYTDGSYEVSEHLKEITIEFLYIFSYNMDKAIKNRNKDILNKCNKELNGLMSVFSSSENLKYTELFLRLKCADLIYDSAYEAFKKNVYDRSSEAEGLMPYILDFEIEHDKLYSRGLLQKYCNFLLRLQKINKVDYWFLGDYEVGFLIMEGDLGSIARRCVFNYKKNKNVQNCLDDIVLTFKYLKENYEKNTIKYFAQYNIVKKRMEVILELMKENNPYNTNFITSLETVLETFKLQEEFEKTL
ncbi:hypothetical protein [Flavobacterium acetivorans]|uniref:hypothetical protein n=1 Tax=Flavobacterium acetivorans TaxID=2893883 RepID=UPI001E52A86E|nr:hypothetical protein [Flavobacterium sp. F-29]UFH35093.1 hypothetical protein LNP19_13530 [Flavobacterium sp. F-29]